MDLVEEFLALTRAVTWMQHVYLLWLKENYLI